MHQRKKHWKLEWSWIFAVNTSLHCQACTCKVSNTLDKPLWMHFKIKLTSGRKIHWEMYLVWAVLTLLSTYMQGTFFIFKTKKYINLMKSLFFSLINQEVISWHIQKIFTKWNIYLRRLIWQLTNPDIRTIPNLEIFLRSKTTEQPISVICCLLPSHYWKCTSQSI